ncbi:mpv17-like protein isoform 2-T2 [Synchiropus picturatus]
MLKGVLKHVRRYPWVTNVTLYGCLFAGGDFVHQWFSHREHMDWRQTRNVAVIAFSFHGNFNFFWMRFLERRFPGNSAGMVFRKLVLDQTTAAPLATSVFYTGVSFLEGKEDIMEDWRDKFLNTYKDSCSGHSCSSSTSPWCLCMCGPPSPAAVRSSGPLSSASHVRVATAQPAPPSPGCFPRNRMG